MSRSLSDISRREERIFVALPVTLRPATEAGAVVTGNTVDYSARGLRIRTNDPFPIQQDVEVFVSQNGNQAQKYLVTWVREKPEGEPRCEMGLFLQ